jgi:hypothetical protein
MEGQSLGNAGTVAVTVVDQTGAAIPNAQAELRNPVSGYSETKKTDEAGKCRFTNVPPNAYHLEVTAPGLTPFAQDVTVRTSVPIPVRALLSVAGTSSTVTVEAAGADILEREPFSHNDVDQTQILKLPSTTPATGLSDVITFSTGGVAADSNGFFHPLGDHAQTSYVVDGQPINDQQSKAFSTQLPANAFQSLELITGTPNAEFGDKTSLIVNAVTRSGLGHKPTGSLDTYYGSFGTFGEEATLGLGGAKFGNFLVVDSLRTGRFLDSPEFTPFHDKGNNATIFDRMDWQPDGRDTFHLNLFGARNWFQVPNTYDQLGQDQKQRATTLSIAPGYQRTFGATSLLTVNPFFRQDRVDYYGSRNPFNDTTATLGQNRHLTNFGTRIDFSYSKGIHNFKIGTELMDTRLQENFALGITDPNFNPVCVNAEGSGVGLPNVIDPAACDGLGYTANPNSLPGLVPYDLTRGGSPFNFHGTADIVQQAVYAQDQLTIKNLTLNLGARFDHYDGISTDKLFEPRAGISYLVKPTQTVLRFGFARTMETPYNENLVLSSATGVGGLAENIFGAFGETSLRPGHRNQYNVGLQQAIGKYVQIDVDYFWKYTKNAYDFDVIFNTPITFPISWKQSRLDGISARIATVNFHGFQAVTTMGHTRARYFPPETGGIIFNSPTSDQVFRIDHDQAFQQTTNLRYQHGKDGWWGSFIWRYDSGLVAGAVTSLDDALSLTAAQQAAIGFFCGGQRATVYQALDATTCTATNYGATRLNIPKEGTENDDTNPPRIAPRHLFDVAFGTDNLLHAETFRTTLRFTVTNLTNNVSLYNFLSTFSGTHFVSPRSYQVTLGFAF